MPKTTFIVKPSTKNSSLWDVQCFSWNSERTRQIFHLISWVGPDDDGNFRGTTASLPKAKYGVRGAIVGVGTKIEVSTEEEWPVVQPRRASWPLSIEVDGAVGTQNSETWYFHNSESN